MIRMIRICWLGLILGTNQGWLGLILGTKLYYNFFAAAVDTDEKFLQQMDALTREIGDRGKVKTKTGARVVPEGVPPIQSSVESQTVIERLLDAAKADRAEAKADRAAVEARLEARLADQRQEMETTIAKLTAPAPAAISDEQIASLQARLEALYTAKMLSDEELYALEDLVADFIELSVSAADVITKQMVYSSPGETFTVAIKLHTLVGLSAAIAGDAAFARQIRRKYL